MVNGWFPQSSGDRLTFDPSPHSCHLPSLAVELSRADDEVVWVVEVVEVLEVVVSYAERMS